MYFDVETKKKKNERIEGDSTRYCLNECIYN